MSWWTRMLRNMAGGGPREAGPPRRPGAASSFHLIWELPGAPVAGSRGLGGETGLTEVSAVLQVLESPRTEALYFWALQVDFLSGGRVWGGAHTGLQWNKRYPGYGAVNWGGYASPERGGFVLPGTTSPLDGFSDDPNTVAYAWERGRPYRLRVFRSPDILGAWRAEVTDLVGGTTTTIRDLLPQPRGEAVDSFLVRPMVWSEVFADCDAPSVTVRWSDLAAVDEAGLVIRPEAVRVNYQAEQAGGCPNTTAVPDGAGGILQVTNTRRLVEQDARLTISGLAGPP